MENKDLLNLIDILPIYIKENLLKNPNKESLIEIVMDLGRKPEARFPWGPEYIADKVISWQDIDYSIKRVGKFSDDNRAGIERTLHRISCIRNRQGLIIGVTCRVGRAMFGTITSIRDLLESNQSILILGKPGVGKTTTIREIARVFSEELEKRVVIIDTSNEIAGDNDIPHIGIGRARRMQVKKSELQHKVMIEAVENHMPEVIIIDEIGTELETLAARTISERGVTLVGTAHGNDLESLIKNPTLTDLIGGIQSVTISDEEARRRGTQKSIMERKSTSAFQIAIEINRRECWTVHRNIEKSIDSILHNHPLNLQNRKIENASQTIIKYTTIEDSIFKTPLLKENWRKNSKVKKPAQNSLELEPTKTNNNTNHLIQNSTITIYNISITQSYIKKASQKLNVNIVFTKDIEKTNAIIALNSHLIRNNKIQEISLKNNIPIIAVKNNTVAQIVQTLEGMLKSNTNGSSKTMETLNP